MGYQTFDGDGRVCLVVWGKESNSALCKAIVL